MSEILYKEKVNKQKIALLPRARLDLFNESLNFLSLSAEEKTHVQSLLDKSELEEKLSVFYSKQNTLLQTVIATEITIVDKGEALYLSLNNESLNKEAPDIIVFVSKNAGLLAKYILPERFVKSAQLFSVGKSCQRFFSDSFFQNQTIQVSCADEESAKGLLSLSAFSDINKKNILICKGTKGLSELQEACESRGAKVKVLDLYQRKPNKNIVLPQQGKITEIYAVSVFALKHLLEGVSPSKAEYLKQIPLLAMSERIASAAKKMGFKKVALKVF